MSKSHKTTTFLGLAVKTPSLVRTMSISEVAAEAPGWEAQAVIRHDLLMNGAVVLNLRVVRSGGSRRRRSGLTGTRIRISIALQSEFICRSVIKDAG